MDLFCLNCGSLVWENYNGEILSLVHPCYIDIDDEESNQESALEYIEKRQMNVCSVLTTESSPLFNMSLMSPRWMSFNKCDKCKTIDEHIEKIIQQYLGKHYKEFIPKNKKICDMKNIFIDHIKNIILNDNSISSEIYS